MTTPSKLKGKKPTAIEKRLKMLLFGPPSSGKTTSAIQFPRPYLIDTERGAENDQYVEIMKKVDGLYLFTNSADELIDEVRTLKSESHPYKTLIIDPLTIIYNELLDRAADKVGTDFGKHKAVADRPMKRLLSLLTALDMNVIITSHAKPNWVRAANNTPVQEGNTFDCYARLDYLFDLVLETSIVNRQIRATVRKSRLSGFVKEENFPFSYDKVAEKYGRKILEKDAAVAAVATPEQVLEIRSLLNIRNDSEKCLEFILSRCKVEDLRDVQAEKVPAILAWLRGESIPNATTPAERNGTAAEPEREPEREPEPAAA